MCLTLNTKCQAVSHTRSQGTCLQTLRHTNQQLKPHSTHMRALRYNSHNLKAQQSITQSTEPEHMCFKVLTHIVQQPWSMIHKRHEWHYSNHWTHWQHRTTSLERIDKTIASSPLFVNLPSGSEGQDWLWIQTRSPETTFTLILNSIPSLEPWHSSADAPVLRVSMLNPRSHVTKTTTGNLPTQTCQDEPYERFA